MSRRLFSCLPHFVMLLVSIALYAAAMRIDAPRSGRIGPDFWPKMVICFMGLLCAFEIVKRLFWKSDSGASGLIGGPSQNRAKADADARTEVGAETVTDARTDAGAGTVTDAGIAAAAATDAAASTDSDARSTPAADRLDLPMFLSGTALILGFVVVVAWVGFFLSTLLFISGFAHVGGFKRLGWNLLLGTAGSLLTMVLFMRVAYISLPLGEGPFRALSLALLRLIGVS